MKWQSNFENDLEIGGIGERYVRMLQSLHVENELEVKLDRKWLKSKGRKLFIEYATKGPSGQEVPSGIFNEKLTATFIAYVGWLGNHARKHPTMIVGLQQLRNAVRRALKNKTHKPIPGGDNNRSLGVLFTFSELAILTSAEADF